MCRFIILQNGIYVVCNDFGATKKQKQKKTLKENKHLPYDGFALSPNTNSAHIIRTHNTLSIRANLRPIRMNCDEKIKQIQKQQNIEYIIIYQKWAQFYH